MNGVTVKDHGANALLRRARELAKGRVVRVGILDDAPKEVAKGAKPSPMTLVEVAAANEFGAPAAGVPQRSFIRATVDEKAPEIRDLQVKLATQALQGKITPEVALERLGLKIVGWIHGRIAEGISPPNADSTIRRKKSSKPLINFGQVRSGVTSRVVDG